MSLDDSALKTDVGSNTPPRNSHFRRRPNHRSTRVSSLGNCYPDRLFHRARRLLHRIALTTAVVAAIAGSRRVTFIVGAAEKISARPLPRCVTWCG
jgi:hypothetical protein